MISIKASVLATLIGMNFSFLDPQIHDADVCAKDSTINFRGAMFLPRYANPAIRERVKDRLGQMHRSGFDLIRTLVGFADRPSSFSDWFDTNQATKEASDLISTYVRDLVEAGFGHAELAFSGQAGANPACRREQWGDCFNKDTILRNIAFVTAVRQGLYPIPAIDLRFDLANEACITSKMAEPLAGNYRSYIRPLVTEYRHQFPQDNVTISCSVERFAAARHDLDETFGATGNRPSFYEIHAYQDPAIDPGETAVRLKRALGDSPAPLVIGETNFDLPNYTQRLLGSLATAGVPIDTVSFWPLKDSEGHCGVDVTTPYTRDSALGVDPNPLP